MAEVEEQSALKRSQGVGAMRLEPLMDTRLGDIPYMSRCEESTSDWADARIQCAGCFDPEACRVRRKLAICVHSRKGRWDHSVSNMVSSVY